MPATPGVAGIFGRHPARRFRSSHGDPVLHEIGIEHHGESKSVEQFRYQNFDLVITVCDDANEECPVWLGRGKRLHEGFRDPVKHRARMMNGCSFFARCVTK